MDTEQLLTIEEAAALVGSSSRLLKMRIHEGKLRSIKRWNRVFISRIDLEAWQEARPKPRGPGRPKKSPENL